MPDDKTKTVADRTRVNVDEPYELAYWARKFGVPREQLIAAVRKVGTKSDDVGRELAGVAPLNPG